MNETDGNQFRQIHHAGGRHAAGVCVLELNQTCTRSVLPHLHPEPRSWPNYLISGFFVYVLLTSAHDRKLWRVYPYGAAGFTFYLVDFVIRMAVQKDVSSTVVMISGFIGLAAALLVILEIALWFRTKAKVVSGDRKDAIFFSK